jgi:predicted nucleic acid-binding protein
VNALIDTNVVLDVLLNRQPFVTDSAGVWRACDAGRFVGYITATTLTTIYYVVEKSKGHGTALAAIDACLPAFQIAPVYRETLMAARRLAGPDFEDDVQIACAMTSFLDAIVTRNTADFSSSPIKVHAPADFLKLT